MKYASSYRQKQFYTLLNEIHFSKISQIIEFLKQNESDTHSLCLEILKIGSTQFNGKDTTLDLYLEFQNKYPNIRLDFYDFDDLKAFSQLTENHNYSYHYGVSDYNLLNTLLELQVNHVTIEEPFTFNIINIAPYIKNKREGCMIHMRPYVGKPGWMLPHESILHHFWVLPQHIDLYEDYIDYIDLFAEQENRETQLIKIYCQEKEYDHELFPLVLNAAPEDSKMRGGFVTDDMAQRRINCKQICMSTLPQRCHMCDIQLKAFEQFLLGRHHTKKERQNNYVTVFENLKNK